MGRREARALGAGDFVEVRGKRYTLHPIAVKQLSELELRAVRFYKRQYLQSLSENSDLLENKQQFMENKIVEVSKWDADDLPYKSSWGVGAIPITDKIKTWLENFYGELPKSENGMRGLINMALESNSLSTAQLKEMTGKAPRQGRIRYDQWWVGSCVSGMVEFVFTSLQYKQPKITLEEVGRWPLSSIAEAARIVEHLTTADLGNG